MEKEKNSKEKTDTDNSKKIQKESSAEEIQKESSKDNEDIREFMKENRLIEFNEGNENLKVESSEKKSINPFFPVKWIAALYFIGATGTFLEFLLMNFKGYIYTLLTSNSLINSDLSTIGTLLRAPFIMLILTLPFIVVGMIIFFLIKYVSDKFNLFSKFEKVAFFTLLGSTIFLITILAYL